MNKIYEALYKELTEATDEKTVASTKSLTTTKKQPVSAEVVTDVKLPIPKGTTLPVPAKGKQPLTAKNVKLPAKTTDTNVATTTPPKQLPASLKPLQTTVAKYIDGFNQLEKGVKGKYLTAEEEEELIKHADAFDKELTSFEDKLDDGEKEAKDVVKRYKTALNRLWEWIYNIRFKGVKLPKNILGKTLGGFYGVYSDILGMKLTQSLLQSLAYSNPLMALAYDNKDIVTNAVNKTMDVVTGND